MKVFFVGAGPGDPELVTLKAKRLVECADIIIWAGSLVNPAVLKWAKKGISVHDSSGMTFETVCDIFIEQKNNDGLIVRLHTGDPSLYGAIQEQIDFCKANDIATEVVPGVSSVFAAAARVQRELTLPGISQSLVITRVSGRTEVPEKENLAALAAHGSSMALFLSGGLLREAAAQLCSVLDHNTPVTLVHRATWPDEKVLSCVLKNMADKAAQGHWEGQTMILIGKVLDPDHYEKSKLYSKNFSHGKRKSV